MTDRTILCAIDFGDLSDLCLAHARAITAFNDAHLHVVYVQPVQLAPMMDAVMMPPQDLVEAARERAQQSLDEVAAPLREGGVRVTTTLAEGEPVQAIQHAAESVDADLVVIATHGRGGIKRALLGSVAAALLADTTRPLYVVHAESQPICFKLPNWRTPAA